MPHRPLQFIGSDEVTTGAGLPEKLRDSCQSCDYWPITALLFWDVSIQFNRALLACLHSVPDVARLSCSYRPRTKRPAPTFLWLAYQRPFLWRTRKPCMQNPSIWRFHAPELKEASSSLYLWVCSTTETTVSLTNTVSSLLYSLSYHSVNTVRSLLYSLSC